MLELLKTTIGRLRIVGFLEGISYLLLFGVSMPLKYGFDMPGPNKVIGMAHGLLFVLYCFYVIMAKVEYKWPVKTMLIALVASMVPFMTFWADKRIFRGRE